MGIKFANKRPYQILKDVSGVLTPVQTQAYQISTHLWPSPSGCHWQKGQSGELKPVTI